MQKGHLYHMVPRSEWFSTRVGVAGGRELPLTQTVRLATRRLGPSVRGRIIANVCARVEHRLHGCVRARGERVVQLRDAVEALDAAVHVAGVAEVLQTRAEVLLLRPEGVG